MAGAASSCIFCRIVAGDLPCERVYEDDETLAFLDIRPCTRGHTLVIPKSHHVSLTDMSAAAAMQLMKSVHTVAKALQISLKIADFNILQNNGTAAGQEVMHVHFHITPRHPGDSMKGLYGKVKATAIKDMYTDPSKFAADVLGHATTINA
jgi:histidine triad (HIT) family protein